jgi:DNA ligase-1
MFAAKALTVQGVFKALLQIAGMSGKNSGTLKKDKIKTLLVASKGPEAQYVVRHLQGKMRIGLAEQTVLVALAHAVALSPPVGSPPSSSRRKEALDRAVEIVKEVFCQLPCYDRIIPELLRAPLEELPGKCFLVPGIPVKPMLAHPTKGISEVLDRFADQTFTCEYKYDGERGQIHRTEGGELRIFSRNSEDNTGKYPDVLTIVPDVTREGVSSFVLDAEVVAFDRETHKILPFQVKPTLHPHSPTPNQTSTQPLAPLRVEACAAGPLRRTRLSLLP